LPPKPAVGIGGLGTQNDLVCTMQPDMIRSQFGESSRLSPMDPPTASSQALLSGNVEKIYVTSSGSSTPGGNLIPEVLLPVGSLESFPRKSVGVSRLNYYRRVERRLNVQSQSGYLKTI